MKKGLVAAITQNRHKSVQVLRGYVRHGSVFRNNASGAVGL